MNYLIIIPLISTILFCFAKILEKQYLTDEDQHETYPLKLLFRDAIVIFSVTLLANFIYIHIYDHLDQIFNIITETKDSYGGLNAEIFTDTPNF